MHELPVQLSELEMRAWDASSVKRPRNACMNAMPGQWSELGMRGREVPGQSS